MTREGQTFAGESRWVTYVNFVKLPHTVFLLPFALVGATLGSYAATVTPANSWRHPNPAWRRSFSIALTPSPTSNANITT